ncbi:MAG: hypothetical protein EBR82_21995 [Caulobacteraceae bacterium]|nr:hypothetical protein [Caulobacteraceae bacterium]
MDFGQRVQRLLLQVVGQHEGLKQPTKEKTMSMTHTIMAVDTEEGKASVLNWECSENTPLGQFFRELTRGGDRFFSSKEGMWIQVKHLHGGKTFTLEFGEPAG